MAFCPNCGTENNGGKFCCNCGAPLPVSQPEQPAVQPAAQPVQQPVVQPVQQPAAQPVMEPVVQPAPQTAPQPVMAPVMEPVVEPVYQQSVQNVYSQAVAPAANEPKTNGMCKTGFILSIVGIFCLGLTSIFGLIFSIIGIVSSSKKKEKGRGLGIAGAIISAFILFVVIFNLAYLQSEFSELFEEITGVSSGVVTAHTTDDDDDDKSNEYVEFIESDNWIETHQDSYLVFERKNSFKYYQTYEDTTNNYFTGKYELYTGKKAIEVITEDYEEAGLTQDEIADILDKWNVDEEYFVCLVLNNDGCWVDGENTQDEKWTTVYVGVLQEEPDVELYLLNVSSATEYLFVPEDDFDFPAVTTETEETAATEETTAATVSETTQSTSATSDYSGYESFGDDISGYVYLTQGNWEVWYEAGVNSDDYDAIYQRVNTDTMTIINISVYTGTYESSNLPLYADNLYSNMSADAGYSNVQMQETVFGGYKAYQVSGLYEDGTNLSIWIFIDNRGKLHYNSVEYLDSDVASYNMFVETYTLK